MIEMDVVGVRIELPSNQPLVLLKESAGTRHIPIWIGAPEASAIAFVQQGIVPPRPMTHDLLVSLVAALNQDVQSFDNMIAALHFHMYQPIALANSGEFGGSTAQVPLPKHERLIAHVHGNQQVAVSVFEVDPSLFKSTVSAKAPKTLKAPPAGYKGRPR